MICHEQVWRTLGGGCLDHNARGVPGCRECEQMAREYLSGWRPACRPNTGDSLAVRVLSDLEDWDLTRTCEQLLALHLGADVDVRPARPEAA